MLSACIIDTLLKVHFYLSLHSSNVESGCDDLSQPFEGKGKAKVGRNRTSDTLPDYEAVMDEHKLLKVSAYIATYI